MTVKILRWIIKRDSYRFSNNFGLIFRLEVKNISDENPWHSMLMFSSEQIIQILNEFDVDTLDELIGLEAVVLEDASFPGAAPRGIKRKDSYYYILTQNYLFV